MKNKKVTLWMLMLLLLSLSAVSNMPSAQAQTGCPADMIHYWKLDETSSPYKDFYGTNDATCTEGCPTAKTGIINGAQQFSTITKVIAADDNTFDWGNADSFSIEFWMKTSACAGTQVIVGRDDPVTSLHWDVACTDAKAEFLLIDTNGNVGDVSGWNDLTDNNWHHIVAVRDASTNELRIYVDGVREGSVTQTFSGSFDSTASLNIGWLNLPTSPHHFVGRIDEVALYNKALSENEIKQHYYDGSVGLRRGYCGCASPVKIMPLGDQITAGDYGDDRDPDELYGFRKPLYLSLVNDGYDTDLVGSLQYGSLTFPPDWDIDHEGHMGWYAKGPGIGQGIAPNVYNFLNANPADVVLLHIGTNDITHNVQYISSISKILDKIDLYSQDITVLLARIINRTDGKSQQTTEFNDDVEAMAIGRIADGDKIIIVDQESALNYQTDMADATHPNDSGYNKMANVWLNALEEFLPVCEQAAPWITSTAGTEAIVDWHYTYDVEAMGNPSPTFSLVTHPSGMTINESTGLIQWTPDSTGYFDVTVQADNGVGTDTQDFTIQVSDPPPCPSDIIHYWKLDEAGSPYKDFYGTNDAACAHCPTATTGVINGAQEFSEITKVSVADDNTFDWGNSDSFSIEFWMKTSACSGTKVIVGRDDPVTPLHWYVACSGRLTEFFLIDTNDNWGGLFGSKDLTDENWHHIVAMRDASANELRIYVDGVIEDSVTQTFSGGFGSTAPLNIGWINIPTGSHHFSGAIDELAIYNKALSDTEILQHYTYGSSNMGYCDPAAPSIISTPVTLATVGELYTYDVDAIGNPAPTYSLITKPAGMTIDSSTGVIQWTPGSMGDFDVTVRASNGVGSPATQSFTINVSEQHTVTATAGSNGSISPSGSILVDHGSTIEFTVTPDLGYKIANVSGCGGTLSGDLYTTAPITADCDVNATFTPYTSVQVLLPNGGEAIPSGSSYTVRWGAPPGTAEFKIKLSLDNGLTWSWITPTPVTGNSHNWTVPIPSGNKKKCLIKVVGYNGSHVKIGADVSNSIFTIEVVRVDQPKAGAVTSGGVRRPIAWTSNKTNKTIKKVRLYYSKDGGITWVLIDKLTDSTYLTEGSHSYLWQVPSVANTKTKCKVKVELLDESGSILGIATNSGYFTIEP